MPCLHVARTLGRFLLTALVLVPIISNHHPLTERSISSGNSLGAKMSLRHTSAILILIIGIFVLTGTSTAKSLESKDSNLGVTMAAFEKIEAGMTYDEVVKIIGKKGTL